MRGGARGVGPSDIGRGAPGALGRFQQQPQHAGIGVEQGAGGIGVGGRQHIGRPGFAAEELCCEVRKVLGERSEGLKHLFCIPRAIYGLNQLIVERFVREENCALSLHARNRRMDVVR